MDKLSGMFKSIVEKVKNMSVRGKVAFSLLFTGIIVLIVTLIVYTGSNKYGLLLTATNADDGKMISDKLKEMKVDTKIKGNSIYVPKEQVDELRLELAPDITNGSKGYELLDSGSGFGVTDKEFDIKKQRVLQGELEKTIKSFSQVENARVHITMPQDSVFVKDSKPGKAAVYLQLKPSAKLSQEQVKSIVALISGSVQNIPKESIEVIDDKMNLLSKGIFDENSDFVSEGAVEKLQGYEADFEKKLETGILELLEPAMGKNKVKVKVNADLDFDSNEKTTIVYDPNKVEVSTHTIEETTNTAGTGTAQSPVDGNMNNTTTGSGNSTNTKKENTTNYNVGKTETKTINAPGEVKTLTASVMIDGRLDAATTQQIEQAVAGVIGFNQNRGDQISIVGMNFDTTAKEDLQAELDAMQKEMEQAQKMALYKNAAIGGGIFVVLITLLIIVLRNRKPKEEVQLAGTGLDMVIGDNIMPKETVKFPNIDLEPNIDRTRVENQVKRYAEEKPDQVADIIKSWLTEDER
jgi:flagellar M-ring protein FliF